MKFSYVKAKNFKSLKDINFDLKKNKNSINHVVSIYGGNGVGKTNILDLFGFLKNSISTRILDMHFSKFLEDVKDKEQFMELYDNLKNSNFKLSDFRMIDEEKPTEIEFGFELNNVEGYYYIKFADRILEEKLYYIVEKQRDIYFEIKFDEDIHTFLNPRVFIDDKHKEDMYEEIEKYWGKHSFLSLLTKDMTEKNDTYVNKRINDKLREIIENILMLSINIKNNKMSVFNIKRDGIIEDLGHGKCGFEEKEILLKYESILNKFFCQIYPDVVKLEYDFKEITDNNYKYELFFNKIIGDKERKIQYVYESTGTKTLLRKIQSLFSVLNGGITIIDEIDNGVHDYLMKIIIASIMPEITGQLIFTSHNTLLLEILPKEIIYIISLDLNGNKTIKSIKEMKINVQKNNNIRDLYFKGVFGGITLINPINMEDIKNEVNQLMNKK